MKKKCFLVLILTFLFTVSIPIFRFTFLNPDIPENESNSNLELTKEPTFLIVSDEYGDVYIYNVTIDKTFAEIGENITVSTVYSLLPNVGYQGSGNIGIFNNESKWFESKNSLIPEVELYTITEIISIDPQHFNTFDNCMGRVEVEIFESAEPDNCKFYINTSIEYLELTRAKLNYSILNQNPLTAFSDDKINLSIHLYNEHSIKYPYSNKLVKIDISNEISSLNTSEYTDSNGIFNFTINCSLFGPGNYIIRFSNNETINYESNVYYVQLEVLDVSTCINCSLLNNGELFTSVDYDDTNYTKAFYLIDCTFDANISWYSNFSSGNCSKKDDIYHANIVTPNKMGNYTIHFIAQPTKKGNQIEFDKILQVKRRPTELYFNLERSENQSDLIFQIKIIDKLINRSINSGNPLEFNLKFNDSNYVTDILNCNSSGIATFIWRIPNNTISDYLNIEFIFTNTPTFKNSSINKNLTLTKLDYQGPFHGISAKNLTISAKLSTLNGKKLSNQLIRLKIDNYSYYLISNQNGEIIQSFIAPSYSTIIKVEIEFLGSEEVIASRLKFNIKIKLDLLHQIWNSLGFVLMSAGLLIVCILYLKKLFTKKNLATLNVD